MSPDRTPEQVERFLLDAVAELDPDLERSQVHRDARLEQLRIDSLGLVEFGQVVQEEYGVRLEPEDFRDVRTVGDALDVVLPRVV